MDLKYKPGDIVFKYDRGVILMIRPACCPRCGSESIWRTHLRDEGDDDYVKHVVGKT